MICYYPNKSSYQWNLFGSLNLWIYKIFQIFRSNFWPNVRIRNCWECSIDRLLPVNWNWPVWFFICRWLYRISEIFHFFNYFVFSVFLYIPECRSQARSMWFSMMMTHSFIMYHNESSFSSPTFFLIFLEWEKLRFIKENEIFTRSTTREM